MHICIFSLFFIKHSPVGCMFVMLMCVRRSDTVSWCKCISTAARRVQNSSIKSGGSRDDSTSRFPHTRSDLWVSPNTHPLLALFFPHCFISHMCTFLLSYISIYLHFITVFTSQQYKEYILLLSPLHFINECCCFNILMIMSTFKSTTFFYRSIFTFKSKVLKAPLQCLCTRSIIWYVDVISTETCWEREWPRPLFK